MKIYTFDAAPNPQRLSLFLKYKGIEIDTQQIDMVAKEQLGDEYQAIVPEGTIPALALDDGTVMTEVIGMCAYLEALHPEKPLMGSSDLERAEVLSWDHRIFMTLLMPIAEALRNGNPNFAGRALPGPLDIEQIPALAERGALRLEHGWAYMNKILVGKTWLAGDSFSLADIDMAVCAGFAGWVKGGPTQEQTTLQAYLARVQAELG